MDPQKREHRGLSPSSYNTFLTCPRKYYHSKVAKTLKDTDVEEDVEALRLGSAFHKCLENTRHELEGYNYASVTEVVKEFELEQNFHSPLLMAMLGKYKSVHEKSGLKAIECEVAIETDTFFGIVDVVLQAPNGDWWIGDIKTAASFSLNLPPTLLSHPQLNLYSFHAPFIAGILNLEPKKYKGCRYLLTTKAKLIRKSEEGTAEFIARLSKTVKSYDFSLPKEAMRTQAIVDGHSVAFDFISKNKEEGAYAQNYSNCNQYYRPCNFWSQCHGNFYTSMPGLEVIQSE